MAIEFTQDTLDEIYAFAVALGRRAGDLLLERIDKQIASDGETAYTYTEKDNAVDIVTQTDEGNPIDTSTPSTKERKKGQSRSYLIDAHPTWCIDPLDGIPPPSPIHFPSG
ncbi:hypothetical protein ACP6JD_002088 [Aspergillus fumigatus]